MDDFNVSSLHESKNEWGARLLTILTPLIIEGFKSIFDVPANTNPLPWTEHWISSKGLQVAPQETEVESYIVGGIKQDVTKDTFSGFQL